MAKGAWDTFGGHVTFELALLSSANALKEASLLTAVREAREEILVGVGGKPYLIQHTDFRQIGRVGQFSCDEPENVEHATAFVLYLPENAVIGDSPFERKDGTVEWLPVEEIPWEDLLDHYHNEPGKFADGISRLLSHPEEIKKSIDQGPPKA
jgi:8-oxo-dGTP pyrophosphatase MutT (NUDIX family)